VNGKWPNAPQGEAAGASDVAEDFGSMLKPISANSAGRRSGPFDEAGLSRDDRPPLSQIPACRTSMWGRPNSRSMRQQRELIRTQQQISRHAAEHPFP
jgi:hypothetical protein